MGDFDEVLKQLDYLASQGRGEGYQTARDAAEAIRFLDAALRKACEEIAAPTQQAPEPVESVCPQCLTVMWGQPGVALCECGHLVTILPEANDE